MMIDRNLIATAAAVCAAACMGAAPAAFPAGTATTLPNGVVIATQLTGETPLVGIQIFLPAGLAQQPAGRSGIAALTAAVVLRTPVEGQSTLTDLAQASGAEITYTVDPQDTRFYIEAKASDAQRFVRDFGAAIAAPDASAFAAARDASIAAADAAVKDPVLVAYAMIRQVQYQGSGYATPDAGRTTDLAAASPSDVSAFAASYRRGSGAIVAMTGNVTDDLIGAVRGVFGSFAAGAAPKTSAPATVTRSHEVIAHRDVQAPWVAVGFPAPSQYSSDFPAMLVIEALLGQGGPVHALSFGPDIEPPDDFVGGYYQFEAVPGTFIAFYNGTNVDQDLRNLSDGVTRLRTGLLPETLLDQAKRSARGTYLTSVATLDDQSWLLGRAAASPMGLSFENDVPDRIAAVTGADVLRVARKYFDDQTVAIVLPNGVGE